VPKAVATGADGLILDLEDSVPLAEKAEGRAAVVGYLAESRGTERPVILVRVNDAETGDYLDDLIAVTEAGADAIVLPKGGGPADIAALDHLLAAIERRCGRTVGETLISPILETPSAIREAYAIGKASARTAYMGGMSTLGGDIERGVGFRWSAGGEETVGFRAQALLDARAAAVPNPISGTWSDVEDLDGFRRFAIQSRDLGYEGMAVIHPSHVAIANEVFSPAPEDLQRDRELIAAMDQAEAEGSAAVRFEGHMVDIAMVRRARVRLQRAASDQAG
jgi:citrate lyase subunit beta/citryl-CoA lyase